MDQQQISYEAIVRADIAIEIMNRARGLITERIAAMETDDPDVAETLREKRRELLAIQNGIRVGDADRIQTVIAIWGPRVRDTALFWREL